MVSRVKLLGFSKRRLSIRESKLDMQYTSIVIHIPLKNKIISNIYSCNTYIYVPSHVM